MTLELLVARIKDLDTIFVIKPPGINIIIGLEVLNILSVVFDIVGKFFTEVAPRFTTSQ